VPHGAAMKSHGSFILDVNVGSSIFGKHDARPRHDGDALRCDDGAHAPSGAMEICVLRVGNSVQNIEQSCTNSVTYRSFTKKRNKKKESRNV